MIIKHVILCGGSNSIWKRQIFLCSKTLKNYYDQLGVPTTASQADIKNSYYELSKLYHPDIAENKEENVQKFREICEAYDILGNVKSRKLYDKGAFIKGKINLKDDVQQGEAVSHSKMKQNVNFNNYRISQFTDSWIRERSSADFMAMQSVRYDQWSEAQTNLSLNTACCMNVVFSGAFVAGFIFYLLWEIEDRRNI